ncbi:MAG: hypothetical protein QXQ53_07205 [Candidatus Methanosuratincola sp.]
MSKKQLEVEVWGGKVLDLVNFPGIKVEFLRYRGCDNESCGHIEHDPIDKVYRVTFPEGTKVRKKDQPNSTEYELPEGPTIRIVHGGDFHDKVLIIETKKTKSKELKMGLG